MQQEKNSKNSPRFGFIYRRGLFFNYFATECFKASLSPPASHSSGDLSYSSLVPKLPMAWPLLMS